MEIGIVNLYDQPWLVRVTERMRPRMTRKYDRRYGVEVVTAFGRVSYADNALTEDEAWALAENVLWQMKAVTLDV